MQGKLKGTAVACIAGLSLAVSAPQAGAVTIGQVSPDPANENCTAGYDFLQPAYAVPSTGGITAWTLSSWSTRATALIADQLLTLKVFRKVSDPAIFRVVAHDGPRPLASGALNTFSTSIPVKPGEVLGFHGPTAGFACSFSAPGDSYRYLFGDLPDNGEGDFSGTQPDFILNVSAVVAPTNTFTLGEITRNKKKGTALLAVNVPNPGELALSGKSVKTLAAGAHTSKAVGVLGTALKIKAKGKARTKLEDTGKAKVNVTVTYTPTGGAPNSQSRKVKLKMKL